MRSISLSAAALAVLAGLTMVPRGAAAADPSQVCEKIAGKSLVTCVKKVNKIQGKCYEDTGAACLSTDLDIGKALDKVAKKIAKKCPSDAIVQGAGYGPLMTVAGLTARLQSQCRADASSLASRTFGGPQGAALGAQDAAGKACLSTLHSETAKLLVGQAKAQNGCVDKQRKSGNCDLTKTNDKIAGLETKALEEIGAACGTADALATKIALNTPQYLDRAAAQARCMTAIAHPDSTPLGLDCGPRSDLIATPRGTYVHVVLNQAETGAVCGDGSDYAFWIRLAPSGQPVENVVLQMQGGGVCIFEDDCNSVPADLFEAMSDVAETSGIMSNDPMVSPFANWTKVYLPYCTQDVFIGGGAVSDFPSVTVQRSGAVDTRAALRYVRDVLWRELDATTPEGYSTDRIHMLFGGTSAGGFGTLYNYHYVLDDLQWAHTTAWPDASLALDNGQLLGIANLGIILISAGPPLGWDALAFLPPYCFANNCGVGPVLYAATAPRLKAVPEQQILVLSNQVDDTQVGTTFFPDLVTWINAMRLSYCGTMGTNGLHYFLPAITASTHVISTREALYTGQAVDGIIMRDWLAGAITSPNSVVDAVEEGTLVTDYPGVNAFPCDIN
jgi:hypothetical protein